MKQLKIFENMESCLSDERVGSRARGLNFSLYSIETPPSIKIKHLQRVTYGAEVFASILIPENDIIAEKESRINAAHMMARFLIDDLRDEILDVLEWAQSEGIGEDLNRRLERLASLTEGNLVENVT